MTNQHTAEKATADAVLEARGLTVRRGGHDVLSDLNFTVQRSELFVLLGGNGAGKSTTLLTFIGLLTPDAGEAKILGTSVASNPAEVRANVAYLPENAALYEHLDAHQNLGYFLSLAGKQADANALEQALDTVALPQAARSRRLESYSKGMRQKVAIALALLRDTPVLLLDEPTSGLDPTAIDEFNALVATLVARGTTVLMVTHDLLGACQKDARIALLREGRIDALVEPEPGAAVDIEELRRLFVGRKAA